MNNDDILKCGVDGSASVPLGPLCGKCGDTTLIVDFILDGNRFSMQSCAGCDRRTWRRAGDDVGLDGVLADLSSATTRFRRDLATR